MKTDIRNIIKINEETFCFSYSFLCVSFTVLGYRLTNCDEAGTGVLEVQWYWGGGEIWELSQALPV